MVAVANQANSPKTLALCIRHQLNILFRFHGRGRARTATFVVGVAHSKMQARYSEYTTYTRWPVFEEFVFVSS